MSQEFDIVCIGGGVAAEALADGLKGSGLSFAVTERRLVGGECPYFGCMPSKTLLRSAETLAEAARARHLAASRVDWEVDFATIARRTHWMARDLDDSGAAAAIEANGATLFRGQARLTGPRSVEVGGELLLARRGMVISTGSDPAAPPIPGLDGVDFWTSRDAVMATELPPSLLILGGGPIGVELGQAFARFGTQVQIVEAADRLMPGEEPEAGRILARYLEAEGIRVNVSARVSAVARAGAKIELSVGAGERLTADRLLVATGRRLNLESLDLQAAGLSTTERGWLRVDPETLQAATGIWAGGEVTGLGAFTHLSWYHGGLIARALRGEQIRADHRAIPRVTFTDPEIASVGLSEAQARDRLGEIRVATRDIGSTARGYIHGEPGGLIKLVADPRREQLAGAMIAGPRAGEIISELSLAILAEVPLSSMAGLMHPFPTFARGLQGMFSDLLSGPG